MSPLRARCVATVLLIAALAACATPASAGAAGEPQITAAGIDASDRPVATWTLAPGTTFDSIHFSASSILEPLLDFEDFADLDSFAGFECTPPPSSCKGTATQTSYRESLRVSRDRRYHVIVNARAGDKTLTSAMWVIDEAKPLIPGEGKPSDTPTNTPVLGRPYVAPAPGTVPAPRFSLLSPLPKTIEGFVRRGIRGRLTCPVVECYAFVALEFGKAAPVLQSGTARPGGRRTFVLRPSRALRAKLRGRSRVRLKLSVAISQPSNKQTEIARNVNLRR